MNLICKKSWGRRALHVYTRQAGEGGRDRILEPRARRSCAWRTLELLRNFYCVTHQLTLEITLLRNPPAMDSPPFFHGWARCYCTTCCRQAFMFSLIILCVHASCTSTVLFAVPLLLTQLPPSTPQPSIHTSQTVRTSSKHHTRLDNAPCPLQRPATHYNITTPVASSYQRPSYCTLHPIPSHTLCRVVVYKTRGLHAILQLYWACLHLLGNGRPALSCRG